MADIQFKERYIGFVFKNFKNPDSYLDYGSFNLGYCEGLDEEFADLTFRFDFSGKLMSNFCFLIFAFCLKTVFARANTMLANTFFSALASIVWCRHHTKKGGRELF